jgi:uncharacterized protein involved in copper resistance
LWKEVAAVSQSDPADEALATIASILDQPEPPHGAEEADKTAANKQAPPEEMLTSDDDDASPTPALDAHGYSKMGPGPMDAIRFRWTVRRTDSGDFYVDETIGENSVPIIAGPMTAEAAIKWVDDRESEAQQRFDRLKSEMAARSDEVELIRLGGGDV